MTMLTSQQIDTLWFYGENVQKLCIWDPFRPHLMYLCVWLIQICIL